MCSRTVRGIWKTRWRIDCENWREHPVANENDLRMLVLRQPVPADLPGVFLLSAEGAGGRLSVWKNPGTGQLPKTEQLCPPQTEYAVADLPAETLVWAEWAGPEQTVVETGVVRLSYTPPDEVSESETCVAVAAGVDLDMDGDNTNGIGMPEGTAAE